MKLQQEADQKAGEIERLNMAYTSEIQQMKLDFQDLNSQIQLLLIMANNEAKVTELNAKLAISENQVQCTEKHLQTQLSKERTLAENNQKLLSEIAELTANVSNLQHKNSMLEADILKKEADISRKDATIARKSTELEANAKSLQDKDAIVAGMKKQLTKAREHLITKQQVLYTL